MPVNFEEEKFQRSSSYHITVLNKKKNYLTLIVIALFYCGYNTIEEG